MNQTFPRTNLPRHLRTLFRVVALAIPVTLTAATQAADDSSARATAPAAAGGPLHADTWTVLGLTVTNPTDDPVNAMVVSSFKDRPNIQFGSRVWVPAHASIQVFNPARLAGAPTEKSVDTESILLDTSVSPERQLSRQEGVIAVSGESITTAALLDSNDETALAAVPAMRAARSLKPTVSYFSSAAFPSFPGSLSGFSNLVVGLAKGSLTGRQAATIHQWVNNGGHLWIMADRVPPDLIKALVGEDWAGEVVDSTELNDFTITGMRAAEKYTSETPVRFVRVLAPDSQATLRVNGWPAAMWKSIGRGELLVTTLDPGPWIMNRKNTPESFNAMAARFYPADFQPVVTDRHVTPPPKPEVALHQFAAGSVGHPIVQRGPVLAILGTFCGLLILSGWWLTRTNRLEHLADAGVVLAGLTTAGMFMLGSANRGATPLTVSSALVANASPNDHYVRLTGVSDVYNPSSFEGGVDAPGGTLIWPDAKSQNGHVIRMNWSQLDRVKWEHLALPSAMFQCEIDETIQIPKPPAARGTFDANGFVGAFDGGTLGQADDALIVAPFGKMAPHFTDGSHFAAGDAEELGPGQFVNSGAVTSERQHRVELDRSLFEGKPRPGRPMLYVWSDALDPAMQVADNTGLTFVGERKGSTLVGMPLVTERPAPDTAFAIPSSFMKMETVRGKEFGPSTPILNATTGSFIGVVANPAQSFLKFYLPREVLPVKVEKYHLSSDLRAPGRAVEIFSMTPSPQGKYVRHTLLTNENGVSEISLDVPADTLQPDADGAVIFGLSVGATDDNTRVWEINNFRLSVNARTTAEGTTP